MQNKLYIAVSIKHSYNQKNGWYLWCPNRSGYTGDIEKAGLYKQGELDSEYFHAPVVAMRKDLAKFYHKKYDTVLVDKEEFIKYNPTKIDYKSQLDRYKKALSVARDEFKTLSNEYVEDNGRVARCYKEEELNTYMEEYDKKITQALEKE